MPWSVKHPIIDEFKPKLAQALTDIKGAIENQHTGKLAERLQARMATMKAVTATINELGESLANEPDRALAKDIFQELLPSLDPLHFKEHYLQCNGTGARRFMSIPSALERTVKKGSAHRQCPEIADEYLQAIRDYEATFKGLVNDASLRPKRAERIMAPDEKVPDRGPRHRGQTGHFASNGDVGSLYDKRNEMPSGAGIAGTQAITPLREVSETRQRE